MNSVSFSALLEEFREARGLSKKQLAQNSNLTPGYISLLTRGERTAPTVKAVMALADALELDDEQRLHFLKVAGYASLFSSATSDLLSNPLISHSHNAGRINDPLAVQRSSIPRQQAFYGREKELEQLRDIILGKPPVCCLAILGIGGVGKTSLTIELAKQIEDEFEYVRWYSFQTPSKETFSNIMTECMRHFSEEPAKGVESDAHSKLESFITCLEKHRCLLILDNFESLLKSGSLVGEYADAYKEYDKLLNLVCSHPHSSCVILTSREKPAEIARLEGPVVKSWLLSGVKDEDARKILRDKGLIVENDAWKRLVQLYSGNPFALQLVSSPIRDVFGGNVEAFLNSLEEKQEQEKIVVSVVHDLLTQQFQRLSAIEQEVLYWLAIEREPVHIQKLREDILQIAARPDLLNVIESLLRRSLIERRNVTKFGLQPLVMDFLTNQLVQSVYDEIDKQRIVLLESHALIKAEAEDYIRREQMRSILEPLKENLLANFNQQEIESKLQNLLISLRKEVPQKPGYTAGNILNLLLYLDYDLHGYDFSSLTVRQAYLREKGLPEVNFAHANLASSVFTDTFGSVLSVALSPDGKFLAAGTANAEVRIWQMEKRTLLHTCKGHSDWVRSVAFSPDGKILASGSHDRTIRLWNVDTGQCIGQFTEHENRVRSVAFSPDDENLLLASSSDDRTIRIWDIQTLTCLHVLPGHRNKVNAIAFNPDDHTLVSVSHDETIRVWDVDKGYRMQELHGQGGWIWSVAFSSDGNTFASGNEDGTISLWKMKADADHGYYCYQTLTDGHKARVNTLVFSPQRDILVSGSDDETLRIWNLSTGHSQPLTGHTNWVRSIAVSYDGSILVSGGDDETVRIWDTNQNQCLYTLQGYSGWVYSVAFNSSTSPLLVSGGEDMRVRIWDASTGDRLQSLHGHTHRVRAVTISPDNSKIASASDDQTVRVWEVDTGILLSLLRGHKQRVRSVAFSPDNSKIASASDDETVRIWEVETGMWIATLHAHSSRVYSVAWSRDSNFLVSGSEDEKIYLWDAHTYTLLKVFSGHKERVYSVNFSPDSAFLVSGGSDRIVRLWEISTATCIHEMTGHTSRICSVAYSPDGQTLASASDDRTVRLWSATTGELLRIIEAHNGRVSSVAFFDNKLLATSSYDGTIRLWNPQTGEQLKILRSERPYEHVNITDVRGLTAAQKAMLKILGAEEESKYERRTL
jgi:WD40 repeat protein/transcriptional regulator with XRE-family HTH domain